MVKIIRGGNEVADKPKPVSKEKPLPLSQRISEDELKQIQADAIDEYLRQNKLGKYATPLISSTTVAAPIENKPKTNHLQKILRKLDDWFDDLSYFFGEIIGGVVLILVVGLVGFLIFYLAIYTPGPQKVQVMNVQGPQAAVAPLVDGKPNLEKTELMANPYPELKVGDKVYIVDDKMLKQKDLKKTENKK